MWNREADDTFFRRNVVAGWGLAFGRSTAVQVHFSKNNTHTNRAFFLIVVEVLDIKLENPVLGELHPQARYLARSDRAETNHEGQGARESCVAHVEKPQWLSAGTAVTRVGDIDIDVTKVVQDVPRAPRRPDASTFPRGHVFDLQR